MFKRSLNFTAIICVLFFCINNISYAGPSLGDWINAVTDVNAAKSVMETERNNYHSIQGDLKTLNDEWDDEQADLYNQRLLSVVAITGAIISVASGGSLYPAAYVMAVALAKREHKETTYSVSGLELMRSMKNLSSLMDTARGNVDAAYNGGYLTVKPHGGYPGVRNDQKHTTGYVPEYDTYLSIAVNHLNSYEHYDGHNYNNVVTLTIETLTSSVKMGSRSGWYHRQHHFGDQDSKTDHVFEKFMTFADFVVNADLPAKYPCKGDGRELFRTPYEAKYDHRTNCGSATYHTNERDTLMFRSAAEGCGYVWYTCDNDNATKWDKHKVRTCKRTYTDPNGVSSTCDERYRHCGVNIYRDHDESDWIPLAGEHSEQRDTQLQAENPSPAPTPTYHACGVHQTWQSGDHSFQASCLLTNDYGDTCEVTGFYACSHTCVFPIACGARSWTNCMANVSASTQHQTTCPAGHSYWSCSSDGVAAHATPITCKRPGCSVTIMKCQNTGNGGCFSNGREYRYHKLQ